MKAEMESLKFTVASKYAADHAIEFLEHTQPFKSNISYVKVTDLRDTVGRTFNTEHVPRHHREHDQYQIELTVVKRLAEQTVTALGKHYREILHLNKNNTKITCLCIERTDMSLSYAQ